jgi:hypothetical protein
MDLRSDIPVAAQRVQENLSPQEVYFSGCFTLDSIRINTEPGYMQVSVDWEEIDGWNKRVDRLREQWDGLYAALQEQPMESLEAYLLLMDDLYGEICTLHLEQNPDSSPVRIQFASLAQDTRLLTQSVGEDHPGWKILSSEALALANDIRGEMHAWLEYSDELVFGGCEISSEEVLLAEIENASRQVALEAQRLRNILEDPSAIEE